MSIVLEQLYKRYEGHPVVNNVSLEVANGEFFVLLGPSGSGKSTVLRMIAGLTRVDGGRITLQGRDVTELLPQQRDTGFVFQHYALFQHMPVGDNVEFALRIRGVPRRDRERRRDELLEMVGLAGLGRRMPQQLSGGQQQRVALARALAHQPAILLLDEPFGALDARIRVELRQTLKHVQRELRMTTIFVTHDQEEAFGLADRLGVMNAGRLLEVGTASELYERPETEFVATFLGSANLLVGTCGPAGVSLGPLTFPLQTEGPAEAEQQRVQVLFRPEDVTLADAPHRLPGHALGEAEVESTTFVGSYERLRLRLPAIAGVQAIAPAVPFGSEHFLVEATRTQEQARQLPLAVGKRAWAGVQRIHALTHPGLRCLIVVDDSPEGRAALAFGGQLVRMAHAHTTLLVTDVAEAEVGPYVQRAKEKIGSGLPAFHTLATHGSPVIAARGELERQLYDLVIVGATPGTAVERTRQYLQAGEHHLLLVKGTMPPPTHILICVASGEPGKDDVLFAGRLARHLGAEATLLSVLAARDNQQPVRERRERWLTAGARALALLGVNASTTLRTGNVGEEISAEMATRNNELLVLGAPFGRHDGQIDFSGVAAQIAASDNTYPILIVRSSYASKAPWLGPTGRVSIDGETVR